MQKENQTLKLSLVIDRLQKLLSIRLDKRDVRGILRAWVLLQKWKDTRGGAGIKKWKTISDDLSRWVIKGRPPELPLFLVPRKGKNGRLFYVVPKNFSWIFCFKKSYRHKILVLTCLARHRIMRATPSYDLSTIENPFPVPYWTAFCSFTREWMRGFQFKLPEIKRRAFAFTLPKSDKSGPNGNPAWRHPVTDFYAILYSDVIYWFIGLLLYYKITVGVTNWSDVKKAVNICFNKCVHGKPIRVGGVNPRPPVDSRIAFLSDKSGKTRVVALGDLWTQGILQTVHDRMYHFLQKLRKVDGTFDQDHQRMRIMEWTKRKLFISSIDMTAATDRFPVGIQAVALWLMGVFKPLEAFLWWGLISKRTFMWKKTHWKRKSRLTEYAVGQPMGFLSSWAAFSLTHHFIVQLASFKAGKTVKKSDGLYFHRYAILGDDVCIADAAVAREYKKIITLLGVTFSPAKSYEGFGIAEFAKHLYVEGANLSPLPWGLLDPKPLTYLQDVVLLYRAIIERGFGLSPSQYCSIWDSTGSGRDHLYSVLTGPGNPERLGSMWTIYDKGLLDWMSLEGRWKQAWSSPVYQLVDKTLESDPIGVWNTVSPFYRKARDVILSTTDPGITELSQYYDLSRTTKFGLERPWLSPQRVSLKYGESFVCWSPEDIPYLRIGADPKSFYDPVESELARARRSTLTSSHLRLLKLKRFNSGELSLMCYFDTLAHESR